jgi:threonine aldolase
VPFVIFASDNWAGAHPAIAASLSTAAGAYHAPYGTSEIDDRAVAALSALFEREVAVFFVATGTAANSLALASLTRPASVMFCHSEAHVIHHEGGAVELQTGGGKLVPVGSAPGAHGKIDPEALRRAMSLFPDDDVHVGEKTALSLTQATEAGTVYTLEEISALSAIASEAGLKTHMDGARFSNAVAALGCTPAEMTWKAGVDILSLGGTKNGCWCAEAVIFFNPEDARAMPRLRKRGANLFSKSAFVAAQFEAWLNNDLWIELARHSNAMARELTEAAQMSAQTRIAWPTQGNQIFLIMTDEKAEALREAGARFYDWETPRGMEASLAPNEKIRRLIASFATREEDVARIAALL